VAGYLGHCPKFEMIFFLMAFLTKKWGCLPYKKIYFVFYLNKIWGRLLFNKTNNVVFNLNFFLVIFDLDKKLWSSYTNIKIFVRFTFTKKCKIPFRTPERPTSVHEHHIFVWDKGKLCNLDTLRLKYVDSSVNIL